MAAAIAFESVSKRFRNGTLALDGASWTVPEGAKACLLGPNGAGKSTSIRLLQGAITSTSGAVEMLGAAVGTPGYWRARRRTGIVPQGPGMYPDVTCGEYLDLAARLYGARPGRVVEAFGLGPYLGTRMVQLSGGFQRRLVLAAALIAEPELLLLDEPTVGLDPVAAHDVHQYLREALADRTALLCTHNLAEAEALCERVVILRDGRVTVEAPLTELRRRFSLRLRLRARQGPQAVVAGLDGRAATAEVDGDAVLLPVEDPGREAPEILRSLLAAGVEVFECSPIQASLQDVFLEAVR